MDRELFEELGLHVIFGESQGESFFFASSNGRCTQDIDAATTVTGDHAYHPCPEAYLSSEIPQGNIDTIARWPCNTYPGTVRTVSIYTPAQATPVGGYALMLCFDGSAYLDPVGPVRAARVLDALISRGEIPPTVGVFVDPGMSESVEPSELAVEGVNDAKRQVINQRSVEYDSLCNRNSDFALEELLPMVETRLGIKLTRAPNQRAVCGMSSGGIAAFTLAWRHPDEFGAVISHCGSYVNIRGGHNYPYLVRTTERKDIRVYLQGGAQDADITLGSWPLANQQMASALAFAGYDHTFVFGSGGHTLRHAGAVFADSLRWIYRE